MDSISDGLLARLYGLDTKCLCSMLERMKKLFISYGLLVRLYVEMGNQTRDTWFKYRTHICNMCQIIWFFSSKKAFQRPRKPMHVHVHDVLSNTLVGGLGVVVQDHEEQVEAWHNRLG